MRGTMAARLDVPGVLVLVCLLVAVPMVTSDSTSTAAQQVTPKVETPEVDGNGSHDSLSHNHELLPCARRFSDSLYFLPAILRGLSCWLPIPSLLILPALPLGPLALMFFTAHLACHQPLPFLPHHALARQKASPLLTALSLFAALTFLPALALSSLCHSLSLSPSPPLSLPLSSSS